MERDVAATELRQRREDLLGRLTDAAEQWSVAALARHLLHGSRETYEAAHRPAVIELPAVRHGLLSRKTQQIIATALAELPESQRTVMTLRDVQGFSAGEVCAALEISPGNQRVLLHRARARVRAALERYLAGVAGG